jgi:hypothetical protein
MGSQTWGFSSVKVADRDERRYVRRINFVGPNHKDLQARLVYDYGELRVELFFST